MISAWTKWRISTAIEKGKPLSPALARRVRRDPECGRFYEVSVAMVERLRQEAGNVVREEEKRLTEMGPLEPRRPAIRPSPRTRPVQPALATTAAAVVIALALGAAIWWWPSSPSVPDAVPTSAVQESDVAELAQIIRQIKNNVGRVAQRKAPQWQQIMFRSGEALRGPMVREAKSIEADTRGILQALSSMIPSGEDAESPDSGDDAPPPSSSGRDVLSSPANRSLARARLPVEIPL